MWETHEIELPAVPASAARARRFVADTTFNFACADVTIEAALLIVSELATNAVVYGTTPFTVGLHHDDHAITIEVTDRSPEPQTPAGIDFEAGRSLQILAALAPELGTRDDGRKIVFVRLPCDCQAPLPTQ